MSPHSVAGNSGLDGCLTRISHRFTNPRLFLSSPAHYWSSKRQLVFSSFQESTVKSNPCAIILHIGEISGLMDSREMLRRSVVAGKKLPFPHEGLRGELADSLLEQVALQDSPLEEVDRAVRDF